MNNKLKYIDNAKSMELQTNVNQDSFLVIIDGTEISSWTDYWNSISKAFCFPELPSYMQANYHSYYDLMTDLTWLKKENIVLIIEHANAFLEHDLQLKNDILNDFQDYLLPFWESEALEAVVNGKTKNFSIYLVKEN